MLLHTTGALCWGPRSGQGGACGVHSPQGARGWAGSPPPAGTGGLLHPHYHPLQLRGPPWPRPQLCGLGNSTNHSGLRFLPHLECHQQGLPPSPPPPPAAAPTHGTQTCSCFHSEMEACFQRIFFEVMSALKICLEKDAACATLTVGLNYSGSSFLPRPVGRRGTRLFLGGHKAACL